MAKIIDTPDGEVEFPDSMGDADIKAVLNKKYAPKPAAPEQPTNSLWDETKRQAGLTGRAALSAVGSFGAVPADAIGKAVNFVAGKEVVPNQQRTLKQTLTRLGLPEAERPIEKFTQGMAETAPAFALPTTLPAQVAGNAAIAATQAPTGQEGMQALVGGGAGTVGHVLGRAMQGFTPTKEAKQLIEQGIQPSFGQSVGGFANKVEQALASNPVSSPFINPMRQRPMQEFEQKVLERATKGGAKGLDEANAYASQLYEEVVPSLKPTPQAIQGVQRALRDASTNPELTADGKQMLLGLVQKHFQNFGQLDGAGIKKLDSELGYLSRKYAAGDPASRTLSSEIQNVQQALREGLEPGLPQALQGKLQTANAIYRNLIPINKAASSRADEAVTPRALQRAMARQQRTDVTRMRPDSLVDPAVAVLPRTLPDSGTAERLITNALPSLLMGGGYGAQQFGFDTLGTGMMAAGALGSRPGARFLTGGYGLQQALAEALRRTTPATVRNLNNE